MFELIYQWFEGLKQNRTDTCRGLDQKIMDLAIRGPTWNNAFTAEADDDVRECYLPKQQIEFLTRSVLKWAYLSHTVLEHWPIVNVSNPDLCGVHIWSGSGTPEEQYAWVKVNFLTAELED